MKACEKHQKEPYQGYRQCVGCELQALKNENESLWATLIKIADALDIDHEEARAEDGKLSAVFIQHIKGLEATIENLEAQVEALGDQLRDA